MDQNQLCKAFGFLDLAREQKLIEMFDNEVSDEECGKLMAGRTISEEGIPLFDEKEVEVNKKIWTAIFHYARNKYKGE